MKIVSWNVNGIRSVLGKGFLNWLSETDPDMEYVRLPFRLAWEEILRAYLTELQKKKPLILCHRVIQSTGALGNYHWGPTRKKAMIGWEAARTSNESTENNAFDVGGSVR